jgi:hypothetical protein
MNFSAMITADVTNEHLGAGFEVLTPVVMKSYILWNIMPCSPLKANQRLGVGIFF